MRAPPTPARPAAQSLCPRALDPVSGHAFFIRASASGHWRLSPNANVHSKSMECSLTALDQSKKGPGDADIGRKTVFGDNIYPPAHCTICIVGAITLYVGSARTRQDLAAQGLCPRVLAPATGKHSFTRYAIPAVWQHNTFSDRNRRHP